MKKLYGLITILSVLTLSGCTWMCDCPQCSELPKLTDVCYYPMETRTHDSNLTLDAVNKQINDKEYICIERDSFDNLVDELYEVRSERDALNDQSIKANKYLEDSSKENTH